MKRVLRDPVVIAILAIGVIAVVVSFLLIRQNQEDNATRWLDQRAEIVTQSTIDTINNTLRDLNAIAAFMGSTDDLSQAQFAEFVDQLDLNPGVIGVGYLALVAGDEIDSFMREATADVPGFTLLRFDGLGGVTPDDTPRATYHPLRFVHGGPFLDIVISETPIESQIDALGFDLASEPQWNPAFERAVEMAAPSISELLEVGGAFEEKAFGVAHPVFGENGELEGMLVAPGLETLLTGDLGVSITDDVTWSVDSRQSEAIASQWPEWTREVELPGSTWTVTVEPTERALAELFPNTTWIVVVVGLGVTLALATTAHQMRLRRREQTEIEDLQRTSADKDRFLAAVSHELRTPLTVVVGLAHELVDRPESFGEEERTALLQMIGEHSEEASAIVADLLVAARYDIGRVPAELEPVDLGEIARAVIDTSALPDVTTIGRPGTAHADPSRVRQILRNLLINAARYGGPQVQVRFTEGASHVAIGVADNGDPIPPDERRRIFDPYTSAHDGGAHMASIGLGLYISLELARLMGGNIAYSHDGEYSLFELTLPRHEQNAKAPAGAIR